PTQASRRSRLALLSCLSIAWASGALAAAIEDAERLYRTGQYAECARLAERETRGVRGEPWHLLKIRAELAQGRDEAARPSLGNGLRQVPWSLSLRLLGRDVYRANGRDDDAKAAIDGMERLILRSPQRYASPEGRVAVGRYFLLRGADARKVLDQFYDV